MACVSLAYRACFGLLVLFLQFLASAVVLGAEAGPNSGGFDVRVDLLAGWPAVPERALALEWARRLGPLAAQEVMQRIVKGDPELWIAGSALVKAFTEVAAANGFFAPAVEAQRASCRALAQRLAASPIGHISCLNGTFAVIGGSEKAFCSPDEIPGLAAAGSDSSKPGGASSRLSVDIVAYAGGLFKSHVAASPPSQEVLICGCIDSAATQSWLAWALALAQMDPMPQNMTVLFRQADCPAPSTGQPAQPDSLTGYGVELRIKSTEYKATVDDDSAKSAKSTKDASDEDEADAVDDETDALKALEGVTKLGMNFGKLASRYPSLGTAFLAFHEQAEAEGMAEDLARWELADLGLQATGRITRSRDPLSTLESLSGSFPGVMAALARDKVRPKIRRAADKGSPMALPRIELDGQQIEDQGPALLPTLRLVENKLAGLALIGLGASAEAVNLVNLSAGNSTTAAVSPQRLDWRDPALKFAYHVRDDPESEDWPRRLGSAIRVPTHDDMFQMGGFMNGMGGSAASVEVKHPVFTIVFVFDPADLSMLQLAVNVTGTTRPARIALIPVTGSNTQDPQLRNASVAASKAFGWLLKAGKKADAASARAFLRALIARTTGKSKGASSVPLNISHVGAALRDAKAGGKSGKGKKKPNANSDKEAKEEAELLKKAATEGESAAEAFRTYASKLGLPSPSIVVNGVVLLPNWSLDSKGGALGAGLKALLKDEEQEIKAIATDKRYKEKKNSKEVDASLEKIFITDRRVATLFDASLTPSLVFEAPMTVEDPSTRSPFAGEDLNAAPASKRRTLAEPQTVVLPREALADLPSFAKGGELIASVDLDLVLFITKYDAAQLIPAFAESLLGAAGSRFTIVVAPPFEPAGPELSSNFWGCLQESTSLEMLSSAKWSSDRVCNTATAGSTATVSSLNRAAAKLWTALPLDTAGLAANGAVVVCNGQLVPDMPLSLPSSTASLVIAHWCPKAPAGVEARFAAAALAAMPRARSEMFKSCDSSAQTPAALRLRLPRLDASAPASVEVAAEIDPLWEGATAFAAIARLMHAKLNAEICIVLRPRKAIEEYPLKRWSRYVVGWPDAQQGGRGPLAAFERLRTKHTLTVAVVSPQSWLVTARRSVHDLDNVRQMDALHGKGPRPEVTATYELERLYVEGSAFSAAGAPAAGLQLELLSPDGSVEDTRVLKNRGFWSMPAVPGRYNLRLKEGASSETFELVGQSARDTTTNDMVLEVTSLDAPTVPLTVRTRPGAKEDDLFRKTFGAGKRSWKKRQRQRAQAKATVSAPAKKAVTNPYAFAAAAKKEEELPTIHIFSVASGHLYERLLAIMILSVRQHTSCPLHFWFIDNFLSPDFKEVLLPALVEKHGGDKMTYDRVTFKWPSWLNPQTEKQRLIWAYKILFLDVLFPMDVPRVIFIDADQVVRADVLELWRMDLRDSVYGFTPFCSGKVNGVPRSNNKTTGFRFWESGYWKSHLGKLPYHISALFVVDLDEFRRRSVGDDLRSTYNSLTRDPSGLANLDQDLPNFAQLQIPIHSLPQEWLWCESWCSNETKPLAKTIDLCQNPQTKEPKIAMAKRIIPEWEGYHRQVLALSTAGGADGGKEEAHAGKQEQAAGARAGRSGEL